MLQFVCVRLPFTLQKYLSDYHETSYEFHDIRCYPAFTRISQVEATLAIVPLYV
jgi:hypothetical protein